MRINHAVMCFFYFFSHESFYRPPLNMLLKNPAVSGYEPTGQT